MMETVQSANIETHESVGEMVAKDLRKADVFKKHGIDFCCGGKKSLAEACEEKGLDEEIIRTELNELLSTANSLNDFSKWSPAFLADYIYQQHHLYFYRENPLIRELLTKVVGHHGPAFPFLYELEETYKILETELNTHFLKEEKDVFPFIKVLSLAKDTGNIEALSVLPSLNEPLRLMEVDHEEAGTLLSQIRLLTNNFTAPDEACNSFRLLYKKLEDLEADLHVHIHLENNILFPGAIKLGKDCSVDLRN